MTENIFWDKKIRPREVARILKDDSHPRFIELAALLLSRTNEPHEVFTNYLGKVLFCRNWRRIKRAMRQNKWSDNRIIFWNEVRDVLSCRMDKKELERGKERPLVADENSQKIGEIVRETRKRLGWTQKDLASKAGLSQQIISFVEKGILNFSLRTLSKILNALKLRISIVSKE